jgi:tight adherence protein B
VTTAAAAAAALALLLWPGRRSARRLRWRRVSDVDTAADTAVARPAGRRLPLPLLAGAVTAALAAVVSTPLVALLAGVLAALGGRAWQAGRRSAADDARLAALTGGLGALAADLRGGLPLESAARAAAAACGDDECGGALVRAVRAPEAPVAGTDALDEPLARVAAAVRLSARTGCSLADVLTAVEDDLRARSRAALELRSATAGPRAGALLLAGLPVLGLAMGSGVGADPWRVLTTTGTGQLLLVAGACLEVAGVTWSGRLVRRALR